MADRVLRQSVALTVEFYTPQEELHVVISPEAYPVTLLAPPLKDRQVLICQGAEAIVTTKGHGRWASLDEILHGRPRPSSADWRNRVMLFMNALELDLVDRTHPRWREHSGPYARLSRSGIDEGLHRVLLTLLQEYPETLLLCHYWTFGLRRLWGGNRQVKAIIQCYAASISNVPEIRYVLGGAEQKVFGDELNRFIGRLQSTTRRELEPRKLFDVLVRLGTDIQNGKAAVPKPDEIFEYVLKSL
ncbi:uncharacterized protein ATNIH1004_003781 [Aspergillus tanneri]|uniref:PARG catalytic Macro domain-containing protein n=1 Tax=Aspergillus tanneri TaxID=1220188 RepID=A0A5M9MW21_9EURO|nr:uncharacterized protein ATNIH1004_003781 [Aspergillus tanneri]KAA8651088.1 hypothetical protein ATNIH1004_003781 [Aspergillus tanneri]